MTLRRVDYATAIRPLVWTFDSVDGTVAARNFVDQTAAETWADGWNAAMRASGRASQIIVYGRCRDLDSCFFPAVPRAEVVS